MRKLIPLFLITICACSLMGCGRSKSFDRMIEKADTVVGIIEEVDGTVASVYCESTKGYPDGSDWLIDFSKMDKKGKYKTPVVGDQIIVYYDGFVMDTYPLEMSKIYTVDLKATAEELAAMEPVEEATKPVRPDNIP